MKRPEGEWAPPGFERFTYLFIAGCSNADQAMGIIGLELKKNNSWMENEMKQTERGWEITLGKFVETR